MRQHHETPNRYPVPFPGTVLLLLLIVGLAGCSAQDDQREFEREALRSPEGYTQTDENGNPDDVQSDSDDWRTSPFFQGLVTVDPAYPNPALSTDDIEIRVDIISLESNIRTLGAYVYYHNTSTPLKPIGNPITVSSTSGWYQINFSASELAQFNNASGLYRVILYDSNSANYGNIVSYGDILIE